MEPGFEEYMLPILRVMSDGNSRRNVEVRTDVLKYMGLRAEDMIERQQNGNLKYKDNINFACSYLFMAGLLLRVSKGCYRISDSGKEILGRNYDKINISVLKDISPEFKDRIQNRNGETKNEKEHLVNEKPELNPIDQIEESERIIRETVKQEILKSLMESSPAFFEKVCKDLMLAMGYGYDNSSSGKVTQYSKDGGIDGIIYTDKLGLEKIYLQAKLYEANNTIGRPLVAQFHGDIDGAKGVFLTTSRFSSDALEYGNKHRNLVLIDGDQLVELMYEHGIGVSVKKEYIVKALDSDYFDDLD